MNKQEPQVNELDEESAFVVDYLKRNPNFFCEHQNLLTRIRVPHESGKAVSLVERQLGLFREKCNNLEQHLQNLVEVATDNEGLNTKLHELACTIISSRTMQELENVLHPALKESFKIDAVMFHLIDDIETKKEGQSENNYKPGELQLIRKSMNEKNTLCGNLTDEQKNSLFAQEANKIESAALIWLSTDKAFGLMALGSNDKEKFTPNKGSVFLEQLRDLISNKVSTFI
jgi:uncharacterized protein YigA (DUF484 family)